MEGEKANQLELFEPAKAVEELGAGEIMLNCIECDGQGKGFDIDLVKLISDAVSIPVIASSGADAVDHLSEVFAKTNASAALAARFFHRKEIKKETGVAGILKSFYEGFPKHNTRSWFFEMQLTWLESADAISLSGIGMSCIGVSIGQVGPEHLVQEIQFFQYQEGDWRGWHFEAFL